MPQTQNNILFPREIPFALTCIVVVHRVFASQPLAGAGLAVDWYVMVAVVVGSVVLMSCTRASLMFSCACNGYRQRRRGQLSKYSFPFHFLSTSRETNSSSNSLARQGPYRPPHHSSTNMIQYRHPLLPLPTDTNSSTVVTATKGVGSR